MRPAAPELAARYRDGMVAEGAHVVDAGQVGTEMLYWLVGARGLDGGLMCTASHNPKAYTGAKFVKEGAIALSGDEGLQEIREAIEAGLGEAPGGGSVEEVDIYPDVPRGRARACRHRRRSSRCASWSRAATGWRCRWSGRCWSASGSTRSRRTGRPTAT